MSFAICLFKRKPDVVDLFSYFRGSFFRTPFGNANVTNEDRRQIAGESRQLSRAG